MTTATTQRLIVPAMVLAYTLSAGAADNVYRDKNEYFEITPPDGWVKKEFNDPRSKVSFDVPAPIAGQNKAGLFFLSHPLSREIDLKTEAEERVARLKQMGSPDAKATTVEFAGVKAERVDGQMGRQNMLLRVFMFTNYGRSYTVQYSATRQDFDTYWPVAEAALKTFRCIPPAGTEATTPAAQVQIDAEKIRVWITALKEQNLGTDAMNSLLGVGASAVPQLEAALQSATTLQRQRITELLAKLRPVAKPSDSTPPNNSLTVEAARTAIVGVWNGTEKPSEGAIVSFDGDGLITEEGFNAGGMLLGSEANRQGKIKYRLDANTNGAGVVIIRINEQGKETPMHLIESFDGESVLMKSLLGSLHSAPSSPAVKWQRIQKEPYKVKSSEVEKAPGK